MADVVVGHGEDDELGEGARLAAHPARSFKERGEVAVHVARIAAPAGQLLAGGGDLPQCLAVAGYAGNNAQYLPAGAPPQGLRCGEGPPGPLAALARGAGGECQDSPMRPWRTLP